MKKQRYLMTDICYRNNGDSSWHYWSYTDGDATGREYNVWLPENMHLSIDGIIEYLNSHVVCIYEKAINPVELKFNLRREPNADEHNFGSLEDYWETREYIFTKKLKQN